MLIYSSNSNINPIASQYFSRIRAAGGDVYDKKSVNNFVNGLSQMVNPANWRCWPMRSIHNIGQGTTVYGMGNLASYNGTRVGSPAWGMNGISITSTAYVDFGTGSRFPQQAPASIDLLVQRDNNPAGSAEIFFAESGGTSAQRRQFRPRINDTNKMLALTKNGTLASTGNGYTTNANFTVWGLKISTNTIANFYRDTAIVPLASSGGDYSNNGDADVIRLIGDGLQNFTSAFAIVYNVDTTRVNADIFNLYRETLGYGLL